MSKRISSDLDILLSRSNNNIRKVELALQASDWRSPQGLSLIQYLTQENKLIEYPGSNEFKEVDILSSIDGIDFKEVFQRSNIAIFNNLPVRIPSVRDLVHMKEISVNSDYIHFKKNQDLQDIADLSALVE